MPEKSAPEEMEREKPRTPEEVSLKRDEEVARRAIEQAAKERVIELKPISGAQPWLVEDPKEFEKISSPELKRMIEVLEKTPRNLLTEELLRGRFLKMQDLIIDGKADSKDADPFLEKINEAIEELVQKKIEAEPEIKKIRDPEAVEGWVDTVFEKLNSLENKASEEGQKLDFRYDYTSIVEALKRVPPNLGVRHEELSEFLGREIKLKEKLEFLVEARRRLHNRTIEVGGAGGSLAQLGAFKVESPLAPSLQVAVTNIRPADWYILTHMDELFPESKNKEVHPPIEDAWELWKAVGEAGAGDEDKEDKEDKKDKKKVEIIYKGKVMEVPVPYKDAMRSDAAMRVLRQFIASQAGSELAEKIVFNILKVSLTLPMWDRGRWSIKGAGGDRETIWFEKTRTEFFRILRPAGPHVTVGSYWAMADQDRPLEDKDLIAGEEDEQRKRVRILSKNKERAVFIYDPKNEKQKQKPLGTIVGDFWSSTYVELPGEKEEEKQKIRLYDIPLLKEIPWLAEGFFEEGTYSGYFGYSLRYAAEISSDLTNMDWDPKEVLTTNFWVTKRRLHNRIGDTSPWLMTRDKKEQERLLSRIRRTFVRGLLWTGSKVSQARAPGLLGLATRGIFSATDVYGGLRPGILDAIEKAGYLDGASIEQLKGEIRGWF